jgi:hypothetical protein
MADTAGPEDRRDGEGTGREKMAVEPEGAKTLRDAGAESEAKGQLSAAGNDREDRGDSGGEKGPDTKPAGDGYYKSQQEVDRAFGRRLASERRRWERELEERRRAESSYDTASKRGEDIDPAQQGIDDTSPGDLAAQGKALAQEYPEFDLMEEIRENPAFARMVAYGIPVSDAYEIAGQERLAERELSIRRDERRRVLEEIESRSVSMPPVDRTAGLSSPALDVTRMSEAELTRLAERVRRGERVVI